jgi:TetR/AcrR family transcriptional regulator, regulator of cefoperazone and chloramphenicol sensitivity
MKELRVRVLAATNHNRNGGPPPAARWRDPAGKRESLIVAATKLFARQGYEGTRTAQIAARAGCSEGLIHRYFGNKKGLLLALIQRRVSKEVVELTDQLPIAPTLEEEVLQLVEWEVRNMWRDQDFLRVIISRALVEPRVGKVLSQAGLSRHVPAIVQRLKHFKQRRPMSDEEMEGLAQSIKTIGLVFGFMRPVLLQQDRRVARRMATTIAKMIGRGVSERRRASYDNGPCKM